MPRCRKLNLERVRAPLDKTCPKYGFTITPDVVKHVDFEQVGPEVRRKIYAFLTAGNGREGRLSS